MAANNPRRIDSFPMPSTVMVMDFPGSRLIFMSQENLLGYAFAELEPVGSFFSRLNRGDLYKMEQYWHGGTDRNTNIFPLRMKDKNNRWQDLICHTSVLTRDSGGGPALALLIITRSQYFADEVAAAIEHADLLSSTQRQAQRLALTNEIIQKALSGSSLKEIMDLLAGLMVKNLGAAGCFITRWDHDQNRSLPYAAAGQDAEVFMETASVSGEATLGEALLTAGSAELAYDQRGRPVNPEGLPTVDESTAVFSLPLKAGEQALGSIVFGFRRPSPFFFYRDDARWEEMASQLSLAISNSLSIEQEKQRRKEAEILQQATFVVASSLDLQEVLDHILAGLVEGVPFDSAAIMLVEGDELRIAALGGAALHTRQVGDTLRRSDGLFSLLESSSAPLVLGDAQKHPKYVQWSKDGKDPIHAWMGIPLIAYDRLIGILALNAGKPDVFSPAHARIAQAFANQAAIAIEKARLFEQVRNGRRRLQKLSKKLVEIQESERRTIAHELHDEIGQQLTGLQFMLEMGREGSGVDQAGVFNDAQGLVQNLMSQVRELSLNLRPAMLDDLGLLPTLQSHFLRYQQRTGIRVAFEHHNLERRFPADVEIAAFRVIQEALTNVARYAAVKEAEVFVSTDDTSIQIRVEDRGRGFDLDILQDNEQSIGLAGINERTTLAGGKFEIHSKPGEGTRIITTFPIGQRVERRRNDRQGDARG